MNNSKKIGFLSHLDLNLYLFRLPIMIELVNRGYSVYAICPKGEKFHLFEKYGIKAISYDINRKSLNPFKEIKTIQNIYKVIKPLNLDILQNFTAKPNIYGSIVGSLSNIPMVINTITGLGSFFISKSIKSIIVRKILEQLYRFSNKKASYVIFQNNDDMQLFIEKKLVKKEKAILIKSSGIDTSFFKPSNIAVNKNIKVLMIARAIWHKGVKEYYEAAKILENKNIDFIYVGATDEENISCASKEFLKTGNVTWLGQRDDIKEIIETCDIFILPSYREGIPRTLLEASSMGKPIITTNAVGCKEVVDDGYNGFLVPIKDSNTLAKKIEILANDSSLRKYMGENARKKALNEFDINIVVKKHIKLYEGENID